MSPEIKDPSRVVLEALNKKHSGVFNRGKKSDTETSTVAKDQSSTTKENELSPEEEKARVIAGLVKSLPDEKVSASEMEDTPEKKKRNKKKDVPRASQSALMAEALDAQDEAPTDSDQGQALVDKEKDTSSTRSFATDKPKGNSIGDRISNADELEALRRKIAATPSVESGKSPVDSTSANSQKKEALLAVSAERQEDFESRYKVHSRYPRKGIHGLSARVLHYDAQNNTVEITVIEKRDGQEHYTEEVLPYQQFEAAYFSEEDLAAQKEEWKKQFPYGRYVLKENPEGMVYRLVYYSPRKQGIALEHHVDGRRIKEIIPIDDFYIDQEQEGRYIHIKKVKEFLKQKKKGSGKFLSRLFKRDQPQHEDVPPNPQGAAEGTQQEDHADQKGGNDSAKEKEDVEKSKKEAKAVSDFLERFPLNAVYKEKNSDFEGVFYEYDKTYGRVNLKAADGSIVSVLSEEFERDYHAKKDNMPKDPKQKEKESIENDNFWKNFDPSAEYTYNGVVFEVVGHDAQNGTITVVEKVFSRSPYGNQVEHKPQRLSQRDFERLYTRVPDTTQERQDSDSEDEKYAFEKQTVEELAERLFGEKAVAVVALLEKKHIPNMIRAIKKEAVDIQGGASDKDESTKMQYVEQECVKDALAVFENYVPPENQEMLKIMVQKVVSTEIYSGVKDLNL